MYYGDKHPHSTQNPIEIKFSELNKKIILKLMETAITENNKNISKKIKLDFKDSNYATGRRKNQ